MTRPAVLNPPRPPGPPGEDGEPGEPRDPLYRDEVEFFEEWLSIVFARDPVKRSGIWCPGWEQHPLAVVVVDSLWRGYEFAIVSPDGTLGAWMVHICVPLMRELFDPDGCFSGCSVRTGHNPGAVPLPVV